MMIRRLAGSGLLLAVMMAGAGQGSAETLQDALRLAYLNNPQLDAQRQQAETAQEQLQQARSQRRPTVGVAGNVGYESTDTTSPFPFFVGDRPIASAQVQGSLPVYTGGRVSSAIRQAQAGIGAADAQLDAVGQNLYLDVVTAYVDVLTAQETIKIRQNSVDLLAEQVRAAQDRFDVGEVTRTDVAQSEARLEGARAALSGAEANFESQAALYAFLVGAPATGLVAVSAAPDLPPTIDAAIAVALSQSPDIEALEFNERAAAEAVNVAEGALKPSVSIVGTASVQQTYDNNYRDTSLSAAVHGSVPLFQGGALRSQVRSSKLRREQARFQTENARRLIQAEVAQAWYGSVAANRSIEASMRQVEAAEIAYRGAQAELAVGVRTTLDVLDQEQQLLEARLTLVRSERDAFVAAHQLLRAMGVLDIESPDAALVQGGGL